MRELQDIIAAYRAARGRDEPLYLATVVRVEGSTYRRPGARMLFTEGRVLAGAISGGCLESNLLRRTPHLLEHARASLVTYDSREDDILETDLGLGCNGLVSVLVERFSLDDAEARFSLLERAHRERLAVEVMIAAEAEPGIPLGAQLWWDESGRSHAVDLSPAQAEAWLRGPRGERVSERIDCPPSLVIFGAGLDVVPVVRLARRLGWRTTVVGTRPHGALKDRFAESDRVHPHGRARGASEGVVEAGALVLLMTHNVHEDEILLEELTPSPAAYVGVLGPRRRLERIWESLEDRGLRFTAAQRGRVFGPVGLDLGAEGPEEIALSILSEVQAFRTQRSAVPLSAHPARIHDEGKRRSRMMQRVSAELGSPHVQTFNPT